MAKKQNGDPVAQAREALATAEAKLQEHGVRKLKLDEQAARTIADLDAATLSGEEQRAEQLATRLARIEKQIASLERTRPQLAKAVEEAQAALKAAEAAVAQEQIRSQDAGLDTLNGEIVEGLARLLAKITQHEELVGVRDRLAKSFDLPTPGRMRFLFPHDMVTSGAADVLRARLDVRHVLGGIQQQPADSGPPLFSVPA